MKTRLGPQRILFPLPTVLIVTGTIKNANIATIAWISLLSGKPPTLGISVGTRGLTGEQIQRNKDFSVNIATVNIMKETDFCGITSGRDTDKFEKTGFIKIPSSIIRSPIIQECPLNLECKLIESKIIGTTNHFVGEIVETHIDSDKIKDIENWGSIDIEAFNPLIYMSGAKEYREIGQKIGDAYQIGKELN
jgi:flavin reductase (DIM6/NTAB) family NADH-FMN oxidoreductase RutF